MKKLLLIVCLILTLGMVAFAGERRETNRLERIDAKTARDIWSDTGVDFGNLVLPQAPGAVSVLTNGSVVFSTGSLPGGSCAVGAIIAPNGSDAISTDTYCTPVGSAGYSMYLELWHGEFPGTWPTGITKFRVLVLSAGQIGESTAYVPVRTCCVDMPSPTVSSVTNLADGSLQVSGQFTAPIVAVNGTLAQITKTTVTSFPGITPQTTTIVLTNTPGLNDGNGILTLCERGKCSQTFFHVSQPYGGSGKG